MRYLTVLFDGRCRLCRRARAWLSAQPQRVELRFVAAGGPAAREAFPELDHERSLNDLAVVSDGNNVYYGAKAWIMCLWALREHGHRAIAFSTPGRLRWARRFVAAVAKNRYRFGTVAVVRGPR